MKILILRKVPDGSQDMLLGMVSNNVPDWIIENAIENALLDVAVKCASRVESADGEGDAWQIDVFLALRSGGRMTVPEIIEALTPNVAECTEDTVRRALRMLRDKGMARPVCVDPETNRAVWEAVV